MSQVGSLKLLLFVFSSYCQLKKYFLVFSFGKSKILVLCILDFCVLLLLECSVLSEVLRVVQKN